MANTTSRYLVIDGSNIATEGRTIPSLAQLEGAVEEIRKELSETEITVVVDATFAHRIDQSERERFEAAMLAGEYVSPPAGAIGRGDAFLLRIAQKVNATVLSNDSFQEFHGEHPWLFETGRLLGATPVPGIGWIFVPRNPVRGPKSRVAVRDATRAKSRIVEAVAVATAEATALEGAASPGRRSRRRSGTEQTAPVHVEPIPVARRPEAVNAPMPFISFIAEHPLGASVAGVVESFTSHGAVIMVGDLRCYVPLAGLGTPPPRSARELLKKGATQEFLVTALDPARRGIELALPGVAVVRGVPTEETVAGEVEMTKPQRRRRALQAAEALLVSSTPTKTPTTPRRVRTSTSARSESQEPAVTPVAAATSAPLRPPGEVLDEAPRVRRRAVATPEATASAPTGPRKRVSTKSPAGVDAVATTPPKKAAATRRAASASQVSAAVKKAAARNAVPRKSAAPRAGATTTVASKTGATTLAAAKRSSRRVANADPVEATPPEGPRRSSRSRS